jgi:hypothetical protein
MGDFRFDGAAIIGSFLLVTAKESGSLEANNGAPGNMGGGSLVRGPPSGFYQLSQTTRSGIQSFAAAESADR